MIDFERGKSSRLKRNRRKSRDKNKARPGLLRRMAGAVFYTLLVLALGGAAALAGVYYHYAKDLPSTEALLDYRPEESTIVYAQDGAPIAEYAAQRRIVVPIEQIPGHVQQAFIAAEDDRFYQHPGFDWMGIARAVWKGMRAGHMYQGGSTITQQLVRNLLISNERTFDRKIRELILAFRIERNLNKQEILELYLNHIYLGHGAYGVEAAANTFYGRGVEDLTLGQAALIAGMPKAPSRYNPFVSPDMARWRRDYVLDRMVKCGYASTEEADAARQEPLKKAEKVDVDAEAAAYFADQVKKELVQRYGMEMLYKGGLRVHTTLDLDMQKSALKAVREGVEAIEARHPNMKNRGRLEGALFAMDPETGYVRALVGGKNYKESQFNRATMAHRQPGSSFKAVIYTAALENGYTPASVIIDAPVVVDPVGGTRRWKPMNFSGRYYGPTDLYSAITSSRNIIAVRLLDRLGVNTVIDYARRMGITSPLSPHLPLALGASGVSPAEMVRAYSVFPNQGMLVQPVLITRVEDRTGRLIDKAEPQWQRAVSPEAAAVMTSMLRGVVEHGTGVRVRALGRECAGKTGTSNNNTDAWFVGFTRDHVAGVWVGRDDNSKIAPGENGGRAAAPIFLAYMKEALKNRPALPFAQPDCVEPGQVAGHRVWFARGTQTTGISDLSASPEKEFMDLDNQQTLVGSYAN